MTIDELMQAYLVGEVSDEEFDLMINEVRW